MSTFVSLAAEEQPPVEHTPSDIGIRSVAGHVLSKGIDVARPTPTRVTPTHDTPTHASVSVSAGPMPAHAVYPSSVRAPRPTLADDDSATQQPAYTGQYAAVCTGLQVQTSAETLTAQSLLLLGRCPTSPHSSHSSVHDWLQPQVLMHPRLVLSSLSHLAAPSCSRFWPRAQRHPWPCHRLSVRHVRRACRVCLDIALHRLWRWKFLVSLAKCPVKRHSW